jgi:hypothetical protein
MDFIGEDNPELSELEAQQKFKDGFKGLRWVVEQYRYIEFDNDPPYSCWEVM